MNIKTLLRSFLEKSSWGRKILRRRKDRQRSVVLANVQKYGPEILQSVERLFSKLGIPYFVADGTLLGIVRDGGIMLHDDDVDFAILPCELDLKEMVLELEKSDFVFFWAWEYEGRISEIGFSYKGVHVDLYLMIESNGRFIEHWYTPIPGVECPTGSHWPGYVEYKTRVTQLKRHHIDKYDIDVMIPRNCEEYLTFSYGEWRVPDPNWRLSTLTNLGSGDERRKRLDGFGRRLSREQFFDLLENKSAK